MYFITAGGLSVYDGERFTNYNEHNGLANELVNDLFEIGPDTILIATNGPYLNILVNGKISPYPFSDSSDHIINRFFRSKDGTLYVLADDGLFTLNQHDIRKIILADDQGHDFGMTLDRITEWKNYFFIIPWSTKSNQKLIIYDQALRKVIITSRDRDLYGIAVTPSGELWISDEKGLHSLNEKAFYKGKLEWTDGDSLSKAGNLSYAGIYFDRFGESWIYRDDEMHHITHQGIHQFFSEPQGLKASRISNVFVDREGSAWIASDGDGVVKMPGTQFQILGDLMPGIKNNISAIINQSDTTWLFNTTDHAFYRAHAGILTSFPLKDKTIHPLNMCILGNSLLIGTGAKIFQVKNKDLVDSYNNATVVFPDSSETVDIGAPNATRDGFIIQYVRRNENSYFIHALKNNKVVCTEKISFSFDQMTLDHEGRLWLATRDNKLLVYTLHPEVPEKYLQLQFQFPTGSESISPRCIALDHSDNIWIGTRYKGIYMYRFDGQKIIPVQHFTTTEGLTDNFHYYLFCDQHNNIWGGAQTGLDQISLKDGKYVIENVTKSNHIFQGVYSIINYSRDEIWALTSNGEIISYALNDAHNDTISPSFFITSLRVNDSIYDIRSDRFTYRQNNIMVSVAAPSFIDEKSVLYSYQLNGSGNNNWSQPANNALFNFINLSPGTYQLNLKAEFPAALYPPELLTYSFTIRPPYWRTWWFWLLISLFTLGLLTLALRYYFARKLEKHRLILEKKQAIEKERTRIATDMHDDLGAGLTRIKFLSETIGIRKQRHLPVEEEINNIREYAHDMIDKMGEIVWALNEKNDSMSDLIAYTRAYAVEYLSENGLKNRVTMPEDFTDVIVSGEFRRNIYLSVKEVLHNIIKHAQAAQVTINFEIANELVIRLTDDGIGFDPDTTRPYSNGLLNIRKRMNDIGGKMEINTIKGTTVKLSAPLA
ncbi:MAG: histidine kinase [Saprospiraceae bacterium]